MSGLSGILDTAKQALLAQQAALHVAGQNVANVNTPGYSRERPVILPARPTSEPGVINGGVSVDHVTRVFDRFVTAQLNVASANFQSEQSQTDYLRQVESLFNDLRQEEGGLASALESFFQGFDDLAQSPEGLTERGVVQQRGTILATTFQELHTGLTAVQQELNNALQDEVQSISRLTSQIADLNGQIAAMEANPKTPANVLRDQRDLAIKQLAEKVGITSFESPSGQMTVLLGGARPIVEGDIANSLIVVPDPDNPVNALVRMQDGKGNQIDVSPNIVSGKIHGLLAVRDTFLPDFTARLDRLAAQLTRSVNDLHSNGFGLDGSTSTNFFVPRQATGHAVAANTGGGTVQSAAVFDPTQLTLDDYEITFTAAGTFDIMNTTTGTAVATGQAYTSGAPIRFAGIEVVIVDGSGAPQAGDIFQVSSTKDAAQNIALTPEVLNDVEKIAAAETPAPGANGTALALARLREVQTIGRSTFGEFQSALVSSIGITTQEHSLLAEQRQSILTEVENRRESIAGVSLEEEQLDLIRFQQAFGAAANFVRIADEMGQTVLSLVR